MPCRKKTLRLVVAGVVVLWIELFFCFCFGGGGVGVGGGGGGGLIFWVSTVEQTCEKK